MKNYKKSCFAKPFFIFFILFCSPQLSTGQRSDIKTQPISIEGIVVHPKIMGNKTVYIAPPDHYYIWIKTLLLNNTNSTYEFNFDFIKLIGEDGSTLIPETVNGVRENTRSQLLLDLKPRLKKERTIIYLAPKSFVLKGYSFKNKYQEIHL